MRMLEVLFRAFVAILRHRPPPGLAVYRGTPVEPAPEPRVYHQPTPRAAPRLHPPFERLPR